MESVCHTSTPRHGRAATFQGSTCGLQRDKQDWTIQMAPDTQSLLTSSQGTASSPPNSASSPMARLLQLLSKPPPPSSPYYALALFVVLIALATVSVAIILLLLPTSQLPFCTLLGCSTAAVEQPPSGASSALRASGASSAAAASGASSAAPASGASSAAPASSAIPKTTLPVPRSSPPVPISQGASTDPGPRMVPVAPPTWIAPSDPSPQAPQASTFPQAPQAGPSLGGLPWTLMAPGSPSWHGRAPGLGLHTSNPVLPPGSPSTQPSTQSTPVTPSSPSTPSTQTSQASLLAQSSSPERQGNSPTTRRSNRSEPSKPQASLPEAPPRVSGPSNATLSDVIPSQPWPADVIFSPLCLGNLVLNHPDPANTRGRPQRDHLNFSQCSDWEHADPGQEGNHSTGEPECGLLCRSLNSDPCLVPAPGAPQDFIVWGNGNPHPSNTTAAGGAESPASGARGALSVPGDASPWPSSVPWHWSQAQEMSVAPPSVPWHWSYAADGCGFKLVTPEAAREHFRGRTIFLAGDSQMKRVLVSLGKLLAKPKKGYNRGEHFVTYLHPDRRTRVLFAKVEYPSNLTDAMNALVGLQECPDTLVLGSGLWHMLYRHHAQGYQYGLGSLRAAILRFAASEACTCRQAGQTEGAKRTPAFFWVGIPAVFPGKMRSDLKQRFITEPCAGAYRAAQERSGLVSTNAKASSAESLDVGACLGSGNVSDAQVLDELRNGVTLADLNRKVVPGPLLEIELHSLTRACGERCTNDGMH